MSLECDGHSTSELIEAIDSRLKMMSALEVLQACLITWLLYNPIWAQGPQQSDFRRLRWESLDANNTDLVFLLDRSGSVGAAGFEMQLGFVHSFLKYFEVTPNATRVAVVSFSDDAVVHANFLKEPGNKCQLVRLTQGVQYLNHHATNTGAGLQKAHEVFHNSRKHTRKVLVLVTDGLATMGPDPVKEADKLKSSGVEVFVFSIGRSIRRHLDMLASSKDHVFECESFAQFQKTFDDQAMPTDRWTVRDNPRDCDRFCRSTTAAAHSCCDKNAVCGCSLSTGLSACLCGPGFYGNGLDAQCTPCRPDTYKETHESGPCTSCPPHSGTRHEGSRSLRDCACEEGFAGDPAAGVPCTPITCPPLQAPEHGRVVACDTEYEGECLFQCDSQHEVAGGGDTAARHCEADGTWSGETTVCKAKTCEKPQDLDNGYVEGCDSPWNVNDSCTFRCNRGYELVGGGTRTCLDWKVWSGEELHCEPVPCPPPPPVPNTHDVGSYRQAKVYRFRDVFAPKCRRGFAHRGPRVLHCDERGQWNSGGEDISQMACVDVEEPKISCPEDIVVAAEPRKASAEVSWVRPLYSDNSGDRLVLQQVPAAYASPHRFPLGAHRIAFRVVDRARLQANCTFTITVRDAEAPQVITCPEDKTLETSENEVTVTWEEPHFVDNSDQLRIEANHASGSKFGHGVHKVVYRAQDSHGNSATCVFQVKVSRSQCPFHPAPLNGALSCDEWMYGQFCQPFCNDEFDFLEEPAEWYICAKDLRWHTEPEGMHVPWPDCARMASPTQAKRMYHGYYYSGDCSDPSVQRAIKNAFRDNFYQARSKLSVCTAGNKCKLDKVSVTCGDVRGPRHRRSLLGSVAGVDAELLLDVSVNGSGGFVNGTEEIAAAIDEIVESIREISPSVLQEVSGRENLTVLMDLIDSSAEDVVIVCAEGETHSAQGCAKCPKGTFHEQSQGRCSPCPVGSYQDAEGSLSCKPCPGSASTAAPKSTSIDDCKLACSPGTFSKDGLETCRACPLGMYQDGRQQARCKRCPAGSTTETFGSSSAADCKEYCTPGTHSFNGLQPCIPCESGTYQELSGQKSCAPCPARTTTLQEGSKSKVECVEIEH